MKTTKKILAMVMAVVLVLPMAIPAFAQTVDSGESGTASITIKNAAKGETYKVVKLFDASVTGDEDGSIVYTGEIPSELADYFETVNGYVQFAEGADEEQAFAAMKTWAESQTETASAVSDGSALTFANLPYGYYVITTTQGAAITVDSTNPYATVYDKNSREPGVTKDVDDKDVDIGQTVTYTLSAKTSSYLGVGEDAQIVTKYVIEDTLPAFLTDVNVTGIVIDQPKGEDITLPVEQFGDDKKIEIPWIDDGNNSKYENGSVIEITYTAKVTAQAAIDGEGNKNEATLTAYTDNDPGEDIRPEPWEETWKDEEIIYTYAAALQKVDENKKPLAGATFAALSLTVEKVSDGVYRVVSYNPESTEYGTEMETDAEGQLVILGLSSETELTVQETVAPAGYNKLTTTATMTPVKTGEEIKAAETTIYYDANGNVTDQETETSYTKETYNVSLLKTAVVVINQAGTELPETGGAGTTLFYVFGAIFVITAVVLLVTKKRMSVAE
jgi:fimbrial isopeptide formation D2 family protein/LPXTG-motif cell wall-anchored protein